MKKVSLVNILILSVLVFWGCYDIKTSTEPTISYTDISGELSGTLDRSGSPYAITADSYVPAGSVWKIEPGVEVRFKGFYRLTVEGTIEAIGTSEEWIIFGSSQFNTANARGNWEGIHFVNPGQASIFEYVRVEDGATYVPVELEEGKLLGALHCTASSPIFRKCLFVKNGFNAVFADSSSAPLIDGCTITDNAFSGIRIRYSSHPVIKNSIIVSNDDYGVVADLYTSAAPRIEYCDIWDNFTTDVYGVDFNTTYWPGIISLDPQFTDILEDDYTLLSHSPCIDAGDPVAVKDADDSRMDMGAFYYDQSNLSELRGAINQKWSTLTTEYNPYKANSDIYVEAGSELVIEPGVIIEFNASTELRFSFDVYGTLNAQGTEANSIIFQSKGIVNSSGDTIKYKGDWDRFKFHEGSDGSLQNVHVVHASEVNFESAPAIVSCQFRNTKNPVLVEDHDIVFELCLFRNNGNAGLNLAGVSENTLIKHCVFFENQGYGLECDDYAKPTITNNLFLHNTIHGIKCYNFCSPEIVNNTFIDNHYNGVLAKLNSNPTIKNNIIYENDKGGIVCQNASYPGVSYNDVYLNNYDSTMVVNQQTGDTTYVIDSTGVNFGNCSGGIGIYDSTGFDVFMNFSADPMFSDMTYWHLSGGSPCIDAGDPAAAYNDADGSRNDLGAYGGPEGSWTPPAYMNSIKWMLNEQKSISNK